MYNHPPIYTHNSTFFSSSTIKYPASFCDFQRLFFCSINQLSLLSRRVCCNDLCITLLTAKGSVTSWAEILYASHFFNHSLYCSGLFCSAILCKQLILFFWESVLQESNKFSFSVSQFRLFNLPKSLFSLELRHTNSIPKLYKI